MVRYDGVRVVTMSGANMVLASSDNVQINCGWYIVSTMDTIL